MTISITLQDDLADKLSQHAGVHDVSVQEWAVRVLEHAVNGGAESVEWSHLQQRRLELIARECSTGLTEEETVELEGLQAAAAKASEPSDRALLDRLSGIEHAAAESAGISNE